MRGSRSWTCLTRVDPSTPLQDDRGLLAVQNYPHLYSKDSDFTRGGFLSPTEPSFMERQGLLPQSPCDGFNYPFRPCLRNYYSSGRELFQKELRDPVIDSSPAAFYSRQNGDDYYCNPLCTFSTLESGSPLLISPSTERGEYRFNANDSGHVLSPSVSSGETQSFPNRASHSRSSDSPNSTPKTSTRNAL